MNERLLSYIETSFIGPLLKDFEITDVSYNGVSFFYVHNEKGRLKADIKVSSEEVMNFIRQIANYSEKQFSYTIPSLDVSIGKYRLNAMHPSIVRVENDKACSFSLRIGSKETRIKPNSEFINNECEKFLVNCLENEQSIMIAGKTGSGKTELQKYLLSKLKKNTRVIVIDNVQELENLRQYEDLDLTSWQVTPNNPNASMEELIRNALRSNPDWLVVAEARGKEMSEVLTSVMTGHPIISTVHAYSLEAIPKRICRLIMKADPSEKYEYIFDDVFEHIKYYVYLNRKFGKDGTVHRFIESIGELQKDGSMKVIYRKK
ncbi:MAG: type II/IV secretion system ATPase subunit [Bacilli bacterium]|nr:type II/IV secretion system ATPase subunit [Bacilli bacterium]